MRGESHVCARIAKYVPSTVLARPPQHMLEQTTISLSINNHFLQPKTHPTIPRVLLKPTGALEGDMFPSQL